MSRVQDQPDRYGAVTRVLHWGMAILFAAQFLSAAAHWALPRENAIREALWGYHVTLGITLFLLVLLRGVWGLINLRRRPSHGDDLLGRAAAAGHAALYPALFAEPARRRAGGGLKPFLPASGHQLVADESYASRFG
jgi:cytochrome b561